MQTRNDQRELDGEINQIISFTVGTEEYGLEILRVKEVIKSSGITVLPNAASFIKGIINLRGDVIPIVDLRDKFGIASGETTAATRVIVVDVDGRLVGMVVDSTSQVVRIPTDQIDPPPPMFGGISTSYLKGVAKLEDRLIVLLNIDNILSGDERQIVDEVSTSGVSTAGVSP